MMPSTVHVQIAKTRDDAIMPSRAYLNDAGWDLYCPENVLVDSGRLTWVPTGIAVSIPPTHYGRIVGRSSAASKGFHVVEGIIDAGYVGELAARATMLWDVDKWGGAVTRGDSICQLIIQPVLDVLWVPVDQENLNVGERGTNGFGSSGR